VVASVSWVRRPWRQFQRRRMTPWILPERLAHLRRLKPASALSAELGKDSNLDGGQRPGVCGALRHLRA
jgi:hypothetical protein